MRETCFNGHFYSPENTRMIGDERRCRTCEREATQRRRGGKKSVVCGEVRRFTKLEQPMGWMDSAACRDLDVNIFFVERGDPTKEARKVCADCPVRAECLDYAITNNEQHGIWGGLHVRQRRNIKQLKATA